MEKLNLFKSTPKRIRVLTEMYDPDQFPATILRRNESIWLKSVEDAFVDFMAVAFDLGDSSSSSLENKIKGVKATIQKFVMTYNNKLISVDLEKDTFPESENCLDSNDFA